MLYVEEQALVRCAEHNDKDGWLYQLLVEVTTKAENGEYPYGTNIVLVFIDLIVERGLRYVSLNWQLEKGADCAEFWRSIIYIFLGKDIGNNSRGQAANMYNVPESFRIDDRTQMRELDQMYLDLKVNSTAVSHVMGQMRQSRDMVHTTNIVGDSDLRHEDREHYMNKYSEKNYKWCRRYVTDAELASVIVDGEIGSGEYMVSKGNADKEENYNIQTKLLKAGYNLGTFDNMKNPAIKDGRDGIYGQVTHNAVELFQQRENVNTVNVGSVDYATLERLDAVFYPLLCADKVLRLDNKIVELENDMAKIKVVTNKY